MSETLNWDEIDANDDEISKEEQASSEDISMTSLVGKFLCTITSVNPVEKTFNAYSCHAAELNLRVEKIIEFEQPLLDDKGKVVMLNGEPVKKVQKVSADKMKNLEATIKGQIMKDEINLFHPKEKPNMKKRRLFVAKKIGILAPNATQLPSSAWVEALGHKVLITSDWNHWKDKVSGEARKNVKVAWDGYEIAPGQKFNDSDLDATSGFADNTNDPSFDTDEFDNI